MDSRSIRLTWTMHAMMLRLHLIPSGCRQVSLFKCKVRTSIPWYSCHQTIHNNLNRVKNFNYKSSLGIRISFESYQDTRSPLHLIIILEVPLQMLLSSKEGILKNQSRETSISDRIILSHRGARASHRLSVRLEYPVSRDITLKTVNKKVDS